MQRERESAREREGERFPRQVEVYRQSLSINTLRIKIRNFLQHIGTTSIVNQARVKQVNVQCTVRFSGIMIYGPELIGRILLSIYYVVQSRGYACPGWYPEVCPGVVLVRTICTHGHIHVHVYLVHVHVHRKQ